MLPDNSTYGTLNILGLITGGGSGMDLADNDLIIEHDLDTDMGIMAEDWKFDILRQLFEAGYEIRNIYGMFNYGCELYLRKNGIKTDVDRKSVV